MHSYLLLLHQLGIGTVVNNIRSEDGCCEFAIDFFCIHVFELPIENKLIAFHAKVNCCLLPE